MSSLNNKKILLAVSGSIAAYKAAYLTRLLIKEGAKVKVIMTHTAAKFISPLTLATLSTNQVYIEIIDEEAWNNHVELGLWADLMLIAPATATTMSKMTHGVADNMVIACYLSAKCPVFFAPAMDLDMWKHPSTLHNVKQLQSYGNYFIPVGHGELASGLIGDGRMAEPEEIIDFIKNKINNSQDLAGKKVLITAGPTYESIDPVRYIGNHSSGKMGIALAEECASRGAEVDLVLGPTGLHPSHENINTIPVTSAEEMYTKAVEVYPQSDIAIMAAAVADYTPATPLQEKMKKKDGDLTLHLKRTKDIAASLGTAKKTGQINIGFALETNDAVANARKKLVKKNFDFIVLNSLEDKGAGFKHDTNKVTLVFQSGNHLDFPLKLKNEVATDIVNAIVGLNIQK
jgi:phosphopantothenoylcysteine decarboxylase/phosphopantothenate--cysteine ligase